ncbi:MAG: hypothetical protein ACTSQ7_07745, partial [Alphaproteobacteria bacterium]
MLIRILATIALLIPAAAHAGFQLYDASWSVKSFGNSRTDGTGQSGHESAWGIPLGMQCNKYFPACPISSTPITTFMGAMTGHPRGSGCTPVTYHPARGETLFSTYTNAKGNQLRKMLFPRFRGPGAFTSAGEPKRDHCTGASPAVQEGSPIAGRGWASTWQGGKAVYIFPATSTWYGYQSGLRGQRS